MAAVNRLRHDPLYDTLIYYAVLIVSRVGTSTARLIVDTAQKMYDAVLRLMRSRPNGRENRAINDVRNVRAIRRAANEGADEAIRGVVLHMKRALPTGKYIMFAVCLSSSLMYLLNLQHKMCTPTLSGQLWNSLPGGLGKPFGDKIVCNRTRDQIGPYVSIVQVMLTTTVILPAVSRLQRAISTIEELSPISDMLAQAGVPTNAANLNENESAYEGPPPPVVTRRSTRRR